MSQLRCEFSEPQLPWSANSMIVLHRHEGPFPLCILCFYSRHIHSQSGPRPSFPRAGVSSFQLHPPTLCSSLNGPLSSVEMRREPSAAWLHVSKPRGSPVPGPVASPRKAGYPRALSPTRTPSSHTSDLSPLTSGGLRDIRPQGLGSNL